MTENKLKKLGIICLHILLLVVIWEISRFIQYLIPFLPQGLIGMIALFLLLYFQILPLSKIALGANFLLSHMLLFFIPATIGITKYKDVLISHGLQIFLGSLLSSILMILLIGRAVEFLIRWEDRK